MVFLTDGWLIGFVDMVNCGGDGGVVFSYLVILPGGLPAPIRSRRGGKPHSADAPAIDILKLLKA